MAKSKIRHQINKAKRNGIDMTQLAYIRESAKKHSEEILQEATDKALLLNLLVVCEILSHDYWEKSAKKRIPEFTEKYLNLLDAYQQKIVDWEQITEDLKEVTGMDFEAVWLKKSQLNNIDGEAFKKTVDEKE